MNTRQQGETLLLPDELLVLEFKKLIIERIDLHRSLDDN